MSERRWNLLKYAFKNAMIGMSRHWALCLSSVFTVFLAMSLIAIFVVLGWTVNTFSVSGAGQMSVHVVVDQNTDAAGMDRIYNDILAVDNVASADVSTREHELDLMIKEKGDAFAIYKEEGEENPLSDAFFVYLNDYSKIAETALLLSQIEGVYDTAYGGSSMQELFSVLKTIRWMSAFFIVLLLMLALFLIYNTIRTTIYSRQSEIGIMWTVGASDAFIRIPFEIEGMLIGLLGAFLPFLAIALGYPRLYAALNGKFFAAAFPLIAPAKMCLVMGFVLFGIGALTGFLASYLSANKYLKNYRGSGRKQAVRQGVRKTVRR